MTRKIEDIIELYEHLTQNGTVDITTIKDSKKRDNITSKPDDDGTLRSTERLPVLHTRINLLKVRKSQKAIFNETPLPKTQTKNQKDFCPMVILEGRAEILQIFCLFFREMELQVNLLLKFPNLYSGMSKPHTTTMHNLACLMGISLLEVRAKRKLLKKNLLSGFLNTSSRIWPKMESSTCR